MVFGGDGAINQVINNIMLSRSNKNVVLVPMPAGTANDFCRALNIESVDRALEAMVDFNIRSVDLLKIEISNGQNTEVKYCSNILGLGLDGDLARRSQKYKRFGVPGYWYASLKKGVSAIFRGMDMYRMRLQSGDIIYDGKLIGVMLSNIDKYGRTFHISPGARPDDGKIHVTVVKPMGGLKSIIVAACVIPALHTRFKQVDSFTCEEVDVELFDDLYSQEDGEVFRYPRGTTFHLSLEKQALNVLAATPSGANGSS